MPETAPATPENVEPSRARGLEVLNQTIDLLDQAQFNAEGALNTTTEAIAAAANSPGAARAVQINGIATDLVNAAGDVSTAVREVAEAIPDAPADNFTEGFQQAGQTIDAGLALHTAAASLLTLAGAVIGTVNAGVGALLSLAAAGLAFLGDILSQIADRIRELFNTTGNEQESEEAQQETQDTQQGENGVSPLIIDLDGDGVESLPLSSASTGQQVFFDIDIDGLAERVAFASPDDGLLVLDRNNNGRIDDGSELFGPSTQNGFTELALLDSNSDGQIDASDDQFNELRIFQDTTQDGFSEESELTTLEEQGIESIDLNFQTISEFDAGNQVLFRSTVNFDDGSTGDIDDVFFQVDQTTSLAVERLDPDFEFSPEIAILPDLFGSAEFAGLRFSASQDTQLAAEVRELVLNAPTLTGGQFRDAVENIVFRWVGVENLDPASRGENIDARHLEVLEAFVGFDFVQQRGLNAGGTDPAPNAGNLLDSTYNGILDQYVLRFASQVELSRIAILRSEGNLTTENAESVFSSLLLLPYNERLGEVLTIDFQTSLNFIIEAIPTSQSEALAFIDLIFGVLPGASSEFFENDELGFFEAIRNGLSGIEDLAVREFAIARATGSAVFSGSSGNELVDTNDPNPLVSPLIRNDDGISQLIDGGSGNDVLTGRTGGDLYLYQRGDGFDIINDLGAPDRPISVTPEEASQLRSIGDIIGNPGGVDRLLLVGISSDEVEITSEGNDIIITVDEVAGDIIRIQDFFIPGEINEIEQIIFQDSIITIDEIISLFAPSVETTGGDGRQIVTGTSGDDLLDGGAGDDFYEFGQGSGIDIIQESAGTGESNTLRMGLSQSFLVNPVLRFDW